MAFYTLILHTLTILACYISSTFEEDAFSPDQGKFEFSFVDDSQKNVSCCIKLFRYYFGFMYLLYVCHVALCILHVA